MAEWLNAPVLQGEGPRFETASRYQGTTMKLHRVTILNEVQKEQPTKVKAVILCGTLSDLNKSSTVKFAEYVQTQLESFGATVNFLHLKGLDLESSSEIEDTADGLKLLSAVDEADIVIFATPIWWGMPSSMIQKVIEKFDEVDEWRRSSTTPVCRWYGKVFGCIIVGDEDGIQACSARMYSWAANMGFTIPPDACARVLGDVDKMVKTKHVEKASKQMASNMVTWAEMLIDNKVKVDNSQQGSVGMFFVSSR